MYNKNIVSVFTVIIILSSHLIAQTNFWAHHSLDFRIIALHKNFNENFYATSDTTVLKSTDYGYSWEVIYTTPIPCPFGTTLRLLINKNYSSPEVMLVRQRNSSTGCEDVPPVLSLDGGNTWNQFNTPGSIIDVDINSFGHIYIVSGGNLYITTDIGNSWQTVNIPQDDDHIFYIETDTLNGLHISKRGEVNMPPDPLTYEHIYKSTDNGQNWDLVLSTGVGFAYGYRRFFSALRGDLFAVTDFETHHYYQGIISYYQFWDIYAAHATTQGNIYCCSTQGVYVSVNEGATWETENSGLDSHSTTSMVSDSLGYLYVSTSDGIYKSNFTSYRICNGTTVEMNDTRLNDTTYKQIGIYNPFNFELTIDSITVFPDDFFISNQSLLTLLPQDSTSIQLAFSPTEFGSQTGEMIFHCGIIRARVEVNGASPKPELISESSIPFGQVRINESKLDTLILTSQSINKLCIDSIFLNKNRFFEIGELTFPKYLEMNDSLNVFITFAPDSIGWLTDTLIILSNAVDSVKHVKVYGIGLSANSVNDRNIITIYKLEQNYPNPFNPETKIEFTIPDMDYVTLKVYDVLGNEVATLINAEKPAGNYEVSFDAKGLSSGIYFYRLQTQSFIRTRKMLLIK